MYRKIKNKESGGLLNLDSLVDILSDIVSSFLFIVMYAILQLATHAYQAEVVVSAEPRANTRRVVVVCQDGMVRVLDAQGSLGTLLSGYEIVQSVDEIERFIAARPAPPSDRFFAYSLRYQFRPTTDFYAMLNLEIAERPGIVGDSLQDLDDRSAYAAALRELDPRDAWLAFAVDTTSVDTFYRARQMAIDAGFATGFDLLSFDFPLSVALSEDGMDDLLSPLTTLSKPLR
jgi:hypothetical protein